MADAKNWKAGIADDTWKVAICGRDLGTVDGLLASLSYYLTDAGNDVEKGIAAIREMSGSQIIDALQDHKRKSLQTIQNALAR